MSVVHLLIVIQFVCLCSIRLYVFWFSCFKFVCLFVRLLLCFLIVNSNQEIRDEEAEWTDYDSDELVVKFRIADSIFENLLRETMAVFSAIESKS